MVFSRKRKYSTYRRKGRVSTKSRKYRRTNPSVIAGYTQSSGAIGRFGRGRIPTGITRELKFYNEGFEVNNAQGTEAGMVIMPNYNTAPNLVRGSMVAGIAQGNSAFQREGRKIVVSTIQIRASVAVSLASDIVTTSNIAPCIRWLLVKDTQCNGLAAAATDVINVGANVFNYNTGNIPFYFKNHFNEERFQIICDQTFPMQKLTTNGWSAPVAINKTFRVNTPILYADGVTKDIALVKSNNFFMIFMSDQYPFAGAGETFQISGAYEIRYYDD